VPGYLSYKTTCCCDLPACQERVTTYNSIQFPGKDHVTRAAGWAVEIAGWVPRTLPNLLLVVAELGDSTSLGVMWSLAVIDRVVANSENK